MVTPSCDCSIAWANSSREILIAALMQASYFLPVSPRRFSNSSAGRYPGTCVPSPKIRFGVPLTRSFLPNANTLSVGALQDAPAGLMPFSIRLSHALTGSFAQYTLRTVSSDPWKIGYKNTYSVTSSILLNSFYRRLQKPQLGSLK